MKEVFEEIKEVSILFGQVLYLIKDGIVLIVLGIAGLAVCPDEVKRLEMYILILIMFLVCVGLRLVHNKYKDLLRKSSGKKRFTFLDEEGNPTIYIEDIQQIVEYLYQIEEEEQNESFIK